MVCALAAAIALPTPRLPTPRLPTPRLPTPRLPTPRMSCVLRCRDSATQANVVLVGTMHGNPVSIDLARSTVCEAAERGALSSVLLEACPTRWERTLATKPKGSLMRRLFDDEMQAAAILTTAMLTIGYGFDRL
eukprot:scaffold9045_cov53-Phaeocystis_antarctica.AAC.3